MATKEKPADNTPAPPETTTSTDAPSVDSLKARVSELEAELEAQDTSNGRTVARLNARIETLEKTQGGSLPYKLFAPTEGVPYERFDSCRQGPEHGWIMHERFYMTQDSGYSNALKARAMDSIGRAFDPSRLGPHDPREGQLYTKMPDFQRGNYLEIIVRVVPAPEVPAEG